MGKENQTSQGSFRYTVVFGILLVVYTAIALWFTFPMILFNLTENRLLEHIAIWKGSDIYEPTAEVEVILTGYSGEKSVLRTVNSGRKDLLHVTLEALLLPLSEEELKAGLISMIPEGTHLKGATMVDGMCFVSLSSRFLEAEDKEEALEQMKKTLSLHFEPEGLVVVSGKEVFRK